MTATITETKPLHRVDLELLQNVVRVKLIGAGGNGSQMLNGLVQLHLGMKALGHPSGLVVETYDPDKVTDANVGRQLFSPADVGQYKAIVLTHRLNMFYGLNWKAFPYAYEGPKFSPNMAPDVTDILITCVDTARARREIGRAIDRTTNGGLKGLTPRYWLDLGNQRFIGQVILGQPNHHPTPTKERVRIGPSVKVPDMWQTPRLPTVLDLNPELKAEDYQEDNTPSCSLAEALEKQSLYVNRHVSCWALSLLETMFRTGSLEHHAYFINLETGRVNPRPVPGGGKRVPS